MGVSKLKHLQRYMTPFELDYRSFEHQPQSQQLSLTFTPKIEEIFESLETSDIDITPSHSIIEPIVNRNFGNIFQHHNGPNQFQNKHKNTSQQHQHINTSQQYQELLLAEILNNLEGVQVVFLRQVTWMKARRLGDENC